MNVQYAKEVIELPAGSGGKAETLLMRLIRAGHYVDAPCGEREPVEDAACALCRRHHNRRQMSGGCSQRKNEAVACAWRVKCAGQRHAACSFP